MSILLLRQLADSAAEIENYVTKAYSAIVPKGRLKDYGRERDREKYYGKYNCCHK